MEIGRSERQATHSPTGWWQSPERQPKRLKNQRHEAFAKALFERSQTGAPPSSVMNSRRPMKAVM
jgi:hypothetical protein